VRECDKRQNGFATHKGPSRHATLRAGTAVDPNAECRAAHIAPSEGEHGDDKGHRAVDHEGQDRARFAEEAGHRRHHTERIVIQQHLTVATEEEVRWRMGHAPLDGL